MSHSIKLEWELGDQKLEFGKYLTDHTVMLNENVSIDAAITKINTVKIREGMVLSNEPGYYKTNNYGIRIENLVYVKKIKKNLFFQNLTMAPIEKDLINFDLLTKNEKNYLLKYHLEVYSRISKYLNRNERRWLASFI